MPDGATSADQGLAFTELTRQVAHDNSQKSTWMYWHYGTKVIILVLGATIPVLTTVNVWSWVIAIVGGTIVVVEGLSQLWHFHDRYVAARVLHRGLGEGICWCRSSFGSVVRYRLCVTSCGAPQPVVWVWSGRRWPCWG